ncbi:MAG: DUF427 domain-containing protein [bacterium]|nr:DUF427 domain-containing protein [bacterium]
MARAIWNGTVIAESDDTVEVDGNLYFPPDSLKTEIFKDSPTTTVCGWKGTANYYHLEQGGEKTADAAWVYRNPKAGAIQLRDRIAFYKSRGIQIEG